MDYLRIGQKDGSNRTSGWKSAAHVNSILLTVTTISLFAGLVASTRQTHGLAKALLFYDGTCDGGTAAQLNVALHLLLNIISTAVFASSNFFMQVLNSPSRKEVDKIHARGSWLGIGVPSVRNAFRVGKFKTSCWLLLLVSSIPLHLLFNSMIFQTEQRDSDYQLTIASEGFVNGERFFAPGASLTPPGWLSGWGNDFTAYNYTNITQFSDTTSTAHRNISAIAEKGAQWNKISATDCHNEYLACNGLKSHRNVIAVVGNAGGWIRDEVWHLLPNQTVAWDLVVPPEETNPLWWSGPCKMYASASAGDVWCQNSCGGALGEYYTGPGIAPQKKQDDSSWTLDFFNSNFDLVNHTGGYWEIHSEVSANRGQNFSYNSWDGNNFTYDLSQNASHLTVSYCLVEPVEKVCHVGLSNTLLLSVAVCVLVKTITAIVVTIVLGQRNATPLVTVGDAVASFIQNPDRTTTGMCTISQRDIRKHFRVSHRAILAGPRRWTGKKRRRYWVVPVSVWCSSYLLFIGAISFTAVMFHTALESAGLTGQFLESDLNSFITIYTWTFSKAVITANSPQLILSFCYLAFNNLFTRLQMAKEWTDYSKEYSALRVTDPKGEQYSTYRLQLPYKYSVPLIICSIFLHWLLSNTIYIFVAQGAYFYNSEFNQPGDDSLPAGTAVSVGFSPYALMTMLIVSVLLICIPVALSFQQLSAGSVSVGTNSIAISAACHVSSVSRVSARDTLPSTDRRKSTSSYNTSPSRDNIALLPCSPLDTETVDRNNGGFREAGPRGSPTSNYNGGNSVEMHDFSSRNPQTSSRAGVQELNIEDVYEQIATSKIRWGVVQMPEEFYREFDNHGRPYDHLSFGVKEDVVGAPIYMKDYA